MRLFALVAILALLWSDRSGHAQDVSTACLRATTSGDAIINCLKASVVLQRAQLRVLRDIREAINRSFNRSMATTASNTARANQQLEVIARALQANGGRPGTYLFVNDLTNVDGSVFDCPTGDCAEDAKVAAEQICRQLNYAGQHSFDFGVSEEDAAVNRMQWVVCRP